MKRIIAILLALITVFSCAFSLPIISSAATLAIASLEDTDDNGKTRIVYYPKELTTSTKKYPAIIWANGTSCPPSYYEDLFKAFAKQGFVIVASNETMAADGTDQIAGLDYIIKKSADKNSKFYNKINTAKITAMGHSQGGRSAVNAAAADSRFCCVVSIAGSNYKEEAEKLKTPTLFFAGTKDLMVPPKDWVIPAYEVCQGPAVYVALIGAGHTVCHSDPARYIDYSVKWMNAWGSNSTSAINTFLPDGALASDPEWKGYEYKNFGNKSAKATISTTKFVYDGSYKKPTVTVTNSAGTKLSSSNYNVYYSKGRKNVGKYTVTIKLKGNYFGTITKTFTIVPKATSISTLTATSKGFKATWKKQATQTTGYQLQYATDSAFTKNVKTVTISKNSATSKSVSSLTGKKKYYVRIRTYKTVSGTKYYSSWSAKKYVTTKA